MGAVTGLELAIGKSLPCGIWNKCPVAADGSQVTNTRPTLWGGGSRNADTMQNQQVPGNQQLPGRPDVQPGVDPNLDPNVQPEVEPGAQPANPQPATPDPATPGAENPQVDPATPVPADPATPPVQETSAPLE